jgi:hypothetical protein
MHSLAWHMSLLFLRTEQAAQLPGFNAEDSGSNLGSSINHLAISRVLSSSSQHYLYHYL